MRFFIYAILFLFVCAIFLKMPIDIPLNATIPIVKGPWFFWGIQECLRKIPALLAAIGLPFFLFFIITLLPLTKGYWEYSIRYFILIFIIAYSTVTIWGLVSY
jgi:hypothetical protein